MLLDLCRRINKERFSVSVVVLQGGNPLAEAFAAAGVTVKFFEKKHWGDRRIIKLVADHLKEEAPDIVHTHLFAGDFWGGLAAKQAGVKNIVSTKHDILNEGWLRNYLGRRSRRQARQVVAISRATQAYLFNKEKIDQNKVKLIYNGIDIDKFYIEEPKLFTSPELQIGVIGRLSPEKGHKYLIQALRLWSHRDWQVDFLADGPLRLKLENQARGLGLEGKIQFRGEVEDVRAYLGKWDIFVLPSISEGLSLALLEAGAAGRCVIASWVGGVPEIVTDQQEGLLFEPKNVVQLTQRLDWVIEHKEEAQKFARQLQKKVVENFDIKKIVQQYESLYENIINQ